MKNVRNWQATISNWVLPNWILLLLGALLVVEMLLSLSWRMNHDTPILYYIASLIDHYSFVPYRDVFETSFPGTILIYFLLAKFFGYSGLAFRFVDLFLLVYVMGISYLIMLHFNKTVAVLGAVSFGLFYLGIGPMLSLQREFLALVPIATAIYCALIDDSKLGKNTKLILIGACFGIVASIKPHLAIGIMPAIGYITLRAHSESERVGKLILRFIKNGCVSGLGFILMFAVPLVWVWHSGGLMAFWEMLREYMPLYLQMTGDHEKVTHSQRLVYILKQWRLGYAGFWVAAILGTYIALDFYKDNKSQMLLIVYLGAEVVLYSFCPAITGQFWVNHWLPFIWICSLCVGWLFLPFAHINKSRATTLAALAAYLFFLAMTFRVSTGTSAFGISFRNAATVQADLRINRVAEFLQKNLKPGDTVQSLDSISGTLHALILANAKLATPFICDYYFYHDQSKPFMQLLRQRYMSALHNTPPRFIIDSTTKLRPKGIDGTDHFDEFDVFLAENYHLALKSDGLTVFEKNL